MQVNDGSLEQISQKQFDAMDDKFGNKANTVKIGDKFKIRSCHFEVTNITSEGLVAKGISKKERDKMTLKGLKRALRK